LGVWDESVLQAFNCFSEMNYTNIKSISHTVHRCKNMFQKKTLKSKKKHAKIKKKRSKTLIKTVSLNFNSLAKT